MICLQFQLIYSTMNNKLIGFALNNSAQSGNSKLNKLTRYSKFFNSDSTRTTILFVLVALSAFASNRNNGACDGNNNNRDLMRILKANRWLPCSTLTQGKKKCGQTKKTMEGPLHEIGTSPGGLIREEYDDTALIKERKTGLNV
ncbi:hypothetical protein C0J52_25931 [Blattella germanica]|nr:hypothetical protein C0J52_25931 [Blattella germanica]